MEIWVDAFKMIDQYEVSNLGNVRRKKSGRPVKTYKRGQGYRTFTPCVDGVIKTISVHKLIYQSFNGEIEPGMVINHKDSDGSNNCLYNLEVCTYSENLHHAVLNGKNKKFNKFLDKKTVIAIYNSKLSQRKIAKKFNICTNSVQKIKECKTYKYHIGLEENSYAK